MVNLRTKHKAAEVEVLSDLSLSDFSALSLLMFKHGTFTLARISVVASAYFYRTVLLVLIMGGYFWQIGLSAMVPFTSFYYILFTLVLSPALILIQSVYYKDYGYDYRYRIFGHYKYNFCFNIIEKERVMINATMALLDFIIIYLPFVLSEGSEISNSAGKEVSINSMFTHKIIIL